MSDYIVGDLIPITDAGLRDKVEQEIEPSIRFESTTDDGNNNYIIDTSGEFGPIDGQPILVNFINQNSGNSTIKIDTMASALPVYRSLSPNTNVLPGDLIGQVQLVYIDSITAFLAMPVYTFEMKDNSSKFLELNDTFPNGSTLYTVNNSFIKENNCMLTVTPQESKLGNWDVDYIDGSVTITSDTTETADVDFKIHIIK